MSDNQRVILCEVCQDQRSVAGFSSWMLCEDCLQAYKSLMKRSVLQERQALRMGVQFTERLEDAR